MTYQATAFLVGPLGREVRRKEFGSERKARRWCRRMLAQVMFPRRLTEVRSRGRLLWSGQEFWDGQHREETR